jgi:hypothetical protein
MAATVLDTFVTKFGFQTDDSGLKKPEKRLQAFKASAIHVAGAVGAVLGGGALLNSIANAADETLKFADSVGVAVEEVGKLEFAVQRQGGTNEGLRSSLENINKTIGEVERGTGRGLKAFEDYNLELKKADGTTKTADELLIDLNKRFAGLSKAKQFDLAMKMGIDKGTIRLLQTAPDEVHRLMMEAKQLGVVSRQEAEAAAAFNDGLTNITTSLKKIGFTIGAVVFKPLSQFFKLIASGIAIIRKHSRFLMIFLGVLAALNAGFIITKVVALAAWAAAFAPIILITAGIIALSAAVALLIDDFIAFKNGQDSLIGDVLKRWPMIGIAIEKVTEALKIQWESVKTLFKLMLKLVTMSVQGWIMLGKIIKGVFDSALEALKPFLDSINMLFEKLRAVKNFAGGKLKSFFGGDTPLAPSPVLTKSQFAGNVSGDRNNSIEVGKIEIVTQATDSETIAQDVSKELLNQFQSTVQDFDSSVDK